MDPSLTPHLNCACHWLQVAADRAKLMRLDTHIFRGMENAGQDVRDTYEFKEQIGQGVLQ